MVNVACVKKGSFRLGWLLRLTECMDEFYRDDNFPLTLFVDIYNKPNISYHNVNVKRVKYQKQAETTFKCESTDTLIELQFDHEPLIMPDQQYMNMSKKVVHHADHNHMYDTIAHTWQDGPYSFIVYTEPEEQSDQVYEIKVSVGFLYKNGYLSANDWPFLPFFATMCAIYAVYALFWLVCCLVYWRDLLRVNACYFKVLWGSHRV